MHKLLSILFISFSLAATSSDIYDNSWALIIGIDKYQNVQKLNYAVDDAESMKNILIDSFNFENEKISILTNEQATKQNILNHFQILQKKLKKTIECWYSLQVMAKQWICLKVVKRVI